MGCGTSKLELSDAEAVADYSVSMSRGSLQLGLSTPVLDDSDKSVPLLKDTAPPKGAEVTLTRQIDPDFDEDIDLPDLPSQGSWTILEHVTRNEREESQGLKTSSRVRTKLKVTKLSGCTLINQYLVVQFLGRGTSGRVYLCMDILEMKLYAINPTLVNFQTPPQDLYPLLIERWSTSSVK
jgi:hypothetical protein